MIRDKLILNDIKDEVNESMSESQVGGREGRSIRDHLFVVYSVLNNVLKKGIESIDIDTYDIRKAFDKLSLTDTCNDIYESGITDDKMSMIFEGNRVNKISVISPVGETERTQVNDILTQGGPIASTMCGVTMDKIGKEAIKMKKYVYKYNGEVEILPASSQWKQMPMSMPV